jgi:hypothetical protein
MADTYEPGDQVVVTHPAQPTSHQGGERLAVTGVSPSGTLVRAVDEQGRECAVWAHEISPAGALPKGGAS